jgi:hypothetical protein
MGWAAEEAKSPTSDRLCCWRSIAEPKSQLVFLTPSRRSNPIEEKVYCLLRGWLLQSRKIERLGWPNVAQLQNSNEMGPGAGR